MKITYRIEGGIAHFPGLARDRTIDVDRLPKARTEALRRAASAALAAAPPGRARGADQRVFVVTIESGKDARTLAISEPAADPAHVALIELIQTN